jgi:hypothetical protein
VLVLFFLSVTYNPTIPVLLLVVPTVVPYSLYSLLSTTSALIPRCSRRALMPTQPLVQWMMNTVSSGLTRLEVRTRGAAPCATDPTSVRGFIISNPVVSVKRGLK